MSFTSETTTSNAGRQRTWPQALLLSSLTLLVLLLLVGCSDDDNGEANSTNTDQARQEMLVNVVDNHVMPGLNQLDDALVDLDNDLQALVANPDATTLATAKSSWNRAANALAKASPYSFGPADALVMGNLWERLGTFPANESLIEDAIAAGNTDFNDNQRDRRGLYTLEYLLYSDTEANILTRLADSAYANYLQAVSANATGVITEVKTAWQDARQEYATNTQTSAGSPMSELFNGMNRSFEDIKNFKLGLPIGMRPGQDSTAATRLEGYYSNSANRLARLHAEAVWALWTGDTSATHDGAGWEEYLEVLGEQTLIDQTKTQWDSIQTAWDNLPSQPWRDLIPSGSPSAVDPDLQKLHTQMSMHTQYFKSGMQSVTGIAITYNSGDGD